MSSHQLLPIAVIGAGPVGLAAAAHLASRDLPFIAIPPQADTAPAAACAAGAREAEARPRTACCG